MLGVETGHGNAAGMGVAACVSTRRRTPKPGAWRSANLKSPGQPPTQLPTHWSRSFGRHVLDKFSSAQARESTARKRPWRAGGVFELGTAVEIAMETPDSYRDDYLAILRDQSSADTPAVEKWPLVCRASSVGTSGTPNKNPV